MSQEPALDNCVYAVLDLANTLPKRHICFNRQVEWILMCCMEDVMMKHHALVSLLVATIVVVSSIAWSTGSSDAAIGTAMQVDGRVALASLMSLSDNHLQKIADSYKLLANTNEVKSADWNRIKAPLSQAAQRNVPSVAWFALPNGTYYSVQQGRLAEKLIDRPYFPRLLAGKTVIGDLVVSKSTGKSVAIVAVPVMKNGKVVGILGSSVYLDKLSKLIEQEMALDKTMIFYSFNAQPLVALNWDPQLIFLEPMKQNNESLKRAFREMLSKTSGTVTYDFRGRQRSVIFRKSPVTNWWYAFGLVEGGREVR